MYHFLLSKEPPDPLQHAVLLGVVRVVLGGNLEQGRESGGVCIDPVAYPFGNLAKSASSRNASTPGGDVVGDAHAG